MPLYTQYSSVQTSDRAKCHTMTMFCSVFQGKGRGVALFHTNL